MKENMNVLINKTLNGIVPVYAVLADIDNGVKCPYAFYRIKQSGVLTKECVRNIYEIGVFLVGDNFDQVNELCEKVKNKIYDLRGCVYAVSGISSAIDYDTDDRKYVCEISFTIKKL